MIKNQSVVIDNGSYMSKCGFGGQAAPQSKFLTLIGKPKYNPGAKNYYVGSQMDINNKLFCQFQPIEFGFIVNWQGIENIWNFCFYNELKVEPENCSCLLTESALNPQENREKMLDLMFESFQVSKCFLAMTSALSLYSAGSTTGIVIDSAIVPIIEGQVIKQSIKRNFIAGNDITKYIQSYLMENHYVYGQQQKSIAKEIKENLCFVGLDYQEQLQMNQGSSGKDESYQLPDGSFITLSEELFKAPEILFQPNTIIGKDFLGIHELVEKSIQMQEDQEIKNKLYSNINLIGGSSLFFGMKERIEKEMQAFAKNSDIVKVFANKERNFSSWLGGSIFTQLQTFNDVAISKQEYQEVGPAILQKKCY